MDIFSSFFIMKVCCVFSLESPRRGDSNENTQYTIFNIKKKITLNYPKSAAMGFCSKGPKNEFQTAMVNETSVFEPLKFYCSLFFADKTISRGKPYKQHALSNTMALHTGISAISIYHH